MAENYLKNQIKKIIASTGYSNALYRVLCVTVFRDKFCKTFPIIDIIILARSQLCQRSGTLLYTVGRKVCKMHKNAKDRMTPIWIKSFLCHLHLWELCPLQMDGYVAPNKRTSFSQQVEEVYGAVKEPMRLIYGLVPCIIKNPATYIVDYLP